MTFLNSLKTTYTASTSSSAYSSVTRFAISRATPKSTRARTFTYSPANSKPALRSASRPFLPTGMTTIFLPCLLRMNSDGLFQNVRIERAGEAAFARQAREPRMRSSGRFASRGCWGDSMRAMVERKHAQQVPWRTAAQPSAASCARRKRAAETNFIARVICCVFFTERMRRRKSSKCGHDSR